VQQRENKVLKSFYTETFFIMHSKEEFYMISVAMVMNAISNKQQSVVRGMVG
jgi:hypothetical protein